MATKKDIKAFLKEQNLTESQMQDFWDELIETNVTCKALHRSGLNWNELNIYLIKQIPTQRQKDIESKKKEEEKETLEMLEKEKAKKEQDYYDEHFEEIMVKKIDNGEDLTEDELKRIRDFSIEDIKGDEDRWTIDIDSIISLCGRTFMLCWRRGLTEYQENEFYNQPFEVESKEKTIVVTEWIRKDRIS